MSVQYYDAIGWVFWAVKPTTESENRLQLDSLSTSSTRSFDNGRQHISCGQRQPPSSGAVVPQSVNGCQLSRGRDGSLRIQSLVEFLISSGHLSPHIGSAWRARHDNNNNNNNKIQTDSLIEWLIVWFFWLLDRLIIWLIDDLIDWLID